MEPISEPLEHLERQAELEDALRNPGGIRVTEERELHSLREHLARYRYSNAVEAVIKASRNHRRPMDSITVTDVERSRGTPNEHSCFQ
jgi:hypothetical protein